MKDLISYFPDINKEDFENRCKEYTKLIEQEFESLDNCNTLPMKLKIPEDSGYYESLSNKSI